MDQAAKRLEKLFEALKRIAELEAEVAALKREWQSIETAPKDGTPILLGKAAPYSSLLLLVEAVSYVNVPSSNLVGFWDLSGRPAWITNATHWMPLPEPPKGEGK